MSVYFNTLKKDNVPEEILKHTKDGRIRKHGRTGAYSIDYDKCIGMTMNFHDDSEPFLILAHFKGDDKQWYLKLTDGTNIYVERKDKAVRNKKWSKNVVIEDMAQEETVTEPIQVTYQLCLPAPMELIDRLVMEVSDLTNNICTSDEFISKVIFIGSIKHIYNNRFNEYRRMLLREYHPDNINANHTDDEFNTIESILNFL